VRDRQNLRILFTLCALWMLLFIPLQPAIADVDDVITDNGGINKTDPSDGSDESAGGGGDDVPWWEEAWDKVVDVGSDWKDQLGEIGKDISNEWNDFLDSSEQVFSDVSDWFDTKWNEAGDWLDTKWNEAGDWLDKTKWAQTLIAAVIATVVIVAVIAGLVALGVVGAISIAVVAVIAVGAIAGGFIYQWIAGDDYSFWGALGSSTVGGILGYLGMASGAFASAWGWLRATAWPAVQGWVRNTAVPWITGKWQAGVNWARTVAFPFIRTKFTAGVNFVRTKFTAGMNWVRTRAFPWVRGKVIAGWNWLKQSPIAKKAGIGFLAGGTSSLFGSLISAYISQEPISITNILIDAGIGAISGGLLGSLMSGASLTWTAVTTLGIYGGIENMLGDLLKGEEGWLSLETFAMGAGVTVISLKVFGPLWEKVFAAEAPAEIVIKTTEEITKKVPEIYNYVEDVIKSHSNQPIEEPKKPDIPNDKQKMENKNSPNQDSKDPTNQEHTGVQNPNNKTVAPIQ
jgi:hypothetical protein